MDTKIKELRAQMATAYNAMQDIQKKADEEKRNFTAEEQAKFDALDNEFENLNSEVKRRESLEERERSMKAAAENRITPEQRAAGILPGGIPTGAGRQDDNRPMSEDERKERDKQHRAAFENWMRYGVTGLTGEERMLLSRYRVSESVSRDDIPAQYRAQSVGTGSAGGYVVPQGFSEELETALKAYGGMRQAARAFPTPSGNDIPWPTVDDTSNVGELLAENTSAAAQDVAFGQVILKSYKYSSKVVLVSIELLQDSYFDIGGILRDLLTTRIGRITNTHFTTGTGTGQPKGVVTEAGSGKVGATGQTTSVIYDDIIDLEHSVDPAYRANAIYMMADSSLKVVKKLKDSSGRPLWMPGLTANMGDPVNGPTLNGYPYVINQDVAAMAANAKSILFGDFSKYVIRDVMAISLLRLEERYAEVGQVGFIAFSRHDGRAINAAALKYYANSAT